MSLPPATYGMRSSPMRPPALGSREFCWDCLLSTEGVKGLMTGGT